MLAGLQRRQRELRVAGVVGGDVNAIHRLVGEDGVEGGIPLEAKRLSRLLTGGIHVGRADELCGLERLEALDVAGIALFRNTVLGDSAEADQNVLDLHVIFLP